MTDNEKAWHCCASRAYAERYQERIKEQRRKYYVKNKSRILHYSYLYDQSHYQERLAYFRNRRMLKAIEEGREFKPRLAARIPEYVTCTAHARHLKMQVHAHDIKYAFANGLINVKRNRGRPRKD